MEEILYIAVAETHNYSGALISGSTRHYLITVDSDPIFFMSYRENLERGFIREFKGEFEEHVVVTYRSERPYSKRQKHIYIAKEPFKVWIRHRGFSGDRCDDYDRVVEAQPIKKSELHSFLKQFNPNC